MTFVVLALVGCDFKPDRGDGAVLPPDQRYLQAPDQTLLAGLVGEPYVGRVSVSGGQPPYTWQKGDKVGLPEGLVLGADGSITGTPKQAGEFSFVLVALDSGGRSKRTVVSLTIALEPRLARCGERLSGSFRGSAFGQDGPDLGDLKNVAWIGVEVPTDDTQRVELVFDNRVASTLYVQDAEQPLGSWNLDQYFPKYLNEFGETVVVVDPGTQPSLTSFQTQELVPMVLVSQTAGDWQLDVVCTDGPVFEVLPQYPTELGTPLEIDFEVFGPDEDVRIWTEDPLPSWMIWDEATGMVSGTAEEVGSWEFTVIAEASDGRRREEESIIGVYDVVPARCGQTVPLTVSQGYFDGTFPAYYDTRGFDVFRVPLDGFPASTIDLRLTGSDGHYLGLATPDPEWLKFYGGAARVYVDNQDATLALDPSTYPATRHYVASGELFVSAASLGVDLEGLALEVSCDRRPLPDFGGLPVFALLEPASHTLEAVGGSPPYTWTAEGLPIGITLSPEGVLSGASGDAGTSSVLVTVTDRFGMQGSGRYPLFVGAEAACGPAERLACGESIDGEFTVNYAQDDNGEGSTLVVCIVDDQEHTYGLELYADNGELRADVADPGSTVENMFEPDNATYVSYVPENGIEAVPLDPFSWPDLDDYDGQRILIGVRAYRAGTWTAHLVCTPKPVE